MPKKLKSVENTGSIDSIEDAVRPQSRQQINIRLSHKDSQRLADLRDYWAKKGSIDFLHKTESGTSVFDSNSSLARFIMETGLDYLYLDLANEKQIERIARRICMERKSHQAIKKKWNLLSSNWQSHKDKSSHDWTSYIKAINTLVRPKILQESIEDVTEEVIEEFANNQWRDEDQSLFDSIWPIAVSRSHQMSDDDLVDKLVLTRTQILQERYGKGGG